jgi:hypothetical protein
VAGELARNINVDQVRGCSDCSHHRLAVAVAGGDRRFDRRSRAGRRQRPAQESRGAAAEQRLPPGQPRAGAAAAHDPLALPPAAPLGAGRRRHDVSPASRAARRGRESEIRDLAAAGQGSPGRAWPGAASTSPARQGDGRARPPGRSRPTPGRSALAQSLALKSAQPRYEAFLARAPSAIAAEAKIRRGAALAERCACGSAPPASPRAPAASRSSRRAWCSSLPACSHRWRRAAKGPPWPSLSTSPPRSTIPTGRRISATPMRRSRPTRSPASSGLMGRDVFFLTGTDEHGLKMAQAAREKGLSPAGFAEEMSSIFSGRWTSSF